MIGIKTANSAHNQLLQSLSSAGILGLAGLLFYSSVLAVYALRAAPLSGGISVALVGLMFLRGFLEAPFTSSNAITSDFFAHLLALAACVGFLPPKPLSATLSTREQVRHRASRGALFGRILC